MRPRQLPALAVLWMLFGCEEDIAQSTFQPTPTKAGQQKPSPGDEAERDEGPPKVEFQEADFTETERSRDPFRSYADLFLEESKSKIRSQREVVLDQYSIDELKLVGIVTGIVPPRAMLVDPTGKGHVVTRGQFVGRAEIVHGGTSGADYEINWRVERVRDGDLVLVREDPANMDVPTATRVLPLRTEDDVQRGR